MIRLDEVAKKLQDILNGIDAETLPLNILRPIDFAFVVQTEGFHIDNIADMAEGKNFIPVFISSMGGQFNPVPELLQAEYVIPISLYFPVRFKEQMFLVNEYLAKIFVGRYLTYGANKKAISNISVAQFGEIQDLDLKQFATWVQTTYKKRVEIMEPYLSMQINLYLSNAADDFVFGNNTETSLSMMIPKYWTITTRISGIYTTLNTLITVKEINGYVVYYWINLGTQERVYTRSPLPAVGDEIYMTNENGEEVIYGTVISVSDSIVPIQLTENVVTQDISIQSHSEPAGQQLIGSDTKETEGYPVNTSYSSGFLVYVKNTVFFKALLEHWFNAKTQNMRFDLTISLIGQSYTRQCYIQSANLISNKGSLVTITFAFGKRIS